MVFTIDQNSDGTVNVQYPGATGGTLQSMTIEEAVVALEQIKAKYIAAFDKGIADLKGKNLAT